MSSSFKLCEPCLYIKEEEAATGFCLTCAEYLCRGCIKEHKKAKLTREHSLLQDGIPENAEILRDLRDMTMCKGHAGIKVTHYCKEHDDFMCAVCCLEKHGTCKDVDKLTEDTKNDNHRVDVHHLLEGTISIIRECTEKAEIYRNVLESDKSNIMEEKTKLKEKTILKLNEMDNKFTEEFNQVFDSVSFEIDKDVTELKHVEQSCVRQQEVLKAASESGDKNNEILVARILTERTVSLKKKAMSLERKSQPRLHFEKNPSLLDLHSVGKVSVINREIINEQPVCTKIEISSDEIQEQETTTETHKENYIKTVTEPSHKMSVHPSPFRFNISESIENKASCIIDTHVTEKYVLLLDYNNTKIKLMPPEFVILNSLRLPGKPLRCCQIDHDEIAVSFSVVRRINRYKININDNTITYQGGFATKLYNNGMSWNGENIVALMSDKDINEKNNAKHDIIELHILNPYDGTIFQKTRNFRVCDSDTKSIRLNLNNTQTILLTDENDLVVAEVNRILCFSLENDRSGFCAKEKRYFVGGKMIKRDEITNIAADHEGIYVATESGIVLQLSVNDYSDARVIITGLPPIQSLKVDQQRKRIIVACENDDIMRVYLMK